MELIEVGWCVDALRRFDELLHVDGPAITSLRDAGVSEARIEALYPFRWADYRRGVERLFEANPSAHGDAAVLSMFDIYLQVGANLPLPLALPCSELYAEKHPEWSFGYPTSRRMLYANLLQLPPVLRALRHYPFPQELEREDRPEHQQLLRNLPKFREITEGWLRLIEAG